MAVQPINETEALLSHMDNCNLCLIGTNCGERDKLAAERARGKFGNIVAKTPNLTATIEYMARGSVMKLKFEKNSPHANERILEQEDGLALETAINGWLH